MRRALSASLCALLMLAGGAAFAAPQADATADGASSGDSPAMPSYIVAAVADPGRPGKDRARDVDRRPAEVLAFSGVKPGDTVVDLMPGGGYFTRIFSKVVGPNGRVYALVPSSLAKVRPDAAAAVQAIAADPRYANVTVLVESFAALPTHGPVDLVWTAQNYHDLHGPALPPATASDLDRAVFLALRPGGAYVIEDHAAAPGSGLRDAGTLHRIDPSVVREEVQGAGLTYEAESPVLHNAADPHTAKVFDPAIRGHTDQFVLKFRKPS